MRILAVTPYYEPEGGGLERYAHAILSRLARRGHRVEALSFTRGPASEERTDGVTVRRRRPSLRVGNTPIHPGFASAVRDEIYLFEPDLVVAHTPVPFPAEMAYRAAQARQVPFVVTYHAGRLRGSSTPLGVAAFLNRTTLERRMLAGAQRRVAVSEFVRANALERHAEDTVVIPPGVDTDRFSPDGPPARAEILFVGPLDSSYRWKGIDVLWDAFARVRSHVPDARLTLVGSGDRAEEFRRKAGDASGAVRLLGRLPEAELAAAYRRAAVVVLPSLTEAESFGMVLAEANACGRAVVASRVGGIPGFVRDGENGLLVRPGDPADLAHALIEVLRDPDRAAAMGRRGRERVVREHDWSRLAADTEEVYRSAAEVC